MEYPVLEGKKTLFLDCKIEEGFLIAKFIYVGKYLSHPQLDLYDPLNKEKTILIVSIPPDSPMLRRELAYNGIQIEPLKVLSQAAS